MTNQEILKRLKEVNSPFGKEKIKGKLGLPIVTYSNTTIYLLDDNRLISKSVDLNDGEIVEEELECIAISEYDENFEPIDSEEKLSEYESQCDYCGELDDSSGYAYFITTKIFN